VTDRMSSANVRRLAMGLITLSLLGRGVVGSAQEFSAPSADLDSFAVLGDGYAVGTFAHPAAALDEERLGPILRGSSKLSPDPMHLPAALSSEGALLPPKRLWPATREYMGPLDWVFRHFLLGAGALLTDTEEYAFPYLVGRAVMVEPKNILLAAQAGARITDAPRQVDRVLAATRGMIPRRLVIGFFSQDLCAPSLARMTEPKLYEAALSRALIYLARNGVAAAGGADVYVLAPFSLIQLTESAAVRQKQVALGGRQVTCGEFWQESYTPRDEGAMMPDAVVATRLLFENQRAQCGSLFTAIPGEDREARISALANRQRAFREAQRRASDEAVAEVLRRYPGKPLRFHFVEETAALTFDEGDIAADCFHLSPAGHWKLAAPLLNRLKSR